MWAAAIVFAPAGLTDKKRSVMKKRILGSIGLLLIGASPAHAQMPLGSAFTYQGNLNDNGSGGDMP